MQGIESAKNRLRWKCQLIDDATKMIDSAKQVSAGNIVRFIKIYRNSYASKTLVTEKLCKS